MIGLKQKYLKISFANIVDMQKVKRDINKAVKVNKEREKSNTYYSELMANTVNPHKTHDAKKTVDHMEHILDIRLEVLLIIERKKFTIRSPIIIIFLNLYREHDVPHHVRVSIDAGVFVGLWYTVRTRGTDPPIITRREDLIEPVEPIVLAYDIETTKLPLKFPDAETDQIMMISYMIDGQVIYCRLITNNTFVS